MATDAKTRETSPVATGAGNGAGLAAEAAAREQALVPQPAPEQLPTWWQHIPQEIASMLMLIRPPMPAAEEVVATKALLKAFVQARKSMGLIPKDKNVNYESRTGDVVDYNFASLDAVHSEITEPLCEHGLSLFSLTSPYAIIVVLFHEEGGLIPCWFDLVPSNDIKDTAKQVTMLRRYLTVTLLCLCADEDTDARDIDENARRGTGGRRPARQPAGGGQRRDARAAGTAAGRGGQSQGPPAGRTQQPPPQQRRGEERAGESRPQGGAASPAGSRPVRTQGANAANESTMHRVQNQIDAALAQLPPERAASLRETYKGKPNELLRAAENEVRQAAGTSTAAPSPEVQDAITEAVAALRMNTAEAMSLKTEYIGRPQDLLTDLHGKVEAAIGRGLRALKMDKAAETALRAEYHNRPNALLVHVRELYNTSQQSAQ